MKNNQVAKYSSAVTLMAVILMAPFSAYAQSGSRLCGWTAKMPNGQVIGLLYEVRTQDNSYPEQCKDAIYDLNDVIKQDPALSKLTWTKENKTACPEIGKQFASTSKPNTDMCDYMEGKKQYKVIKESGENTTYSKM